MQSFTLRSHRGRNRDTGEFTERVREMSSQLSYYIHYLCIYPSAHKQLRRHLPTPFHEFSCSISLRILILSRDTSYTITAPPPKSNNWLNSILYVTTSITHQYYRGIHEKGSGDVVSAVCVQRDRKIVYIV